MSGFDSSRVEAAVVELLQAFGVDPLEASFRKTPQRVARFYEEFFSRIQRDPQEELGEMFDAADAQVSTILLRDISFVSLCEHHLLPFRGKAHIAYVPKKKYAGFAGVSRMIDVWASRPQMQERLSENIADSLWKATNPHGVYVVLEAQHECLRLRNQQQESATITTLSSRGIYDDPQQRADVVEFLRRKKSCS